MSIRDQVAEMLTAEIDLAIDQFWSSEYASKCGSEIERAFAAAMILGGRPHRIGIAEGREIVQPGDIWFLEPQVTIGPYRVDFLLGSPARKDDLLNCVAIECDGHAFHERTKEQAAHDKARDRFLSTQVGRVLRFTGSEIYRDSSACISEALTMLDLVMFGRPSK